MRTRDDGDEVQAQAARAADRRDARRHYRIAARGRHDDRAAAVRRTDGGELDVAPEAVQIDRVVVRDAARERNVETPGDAFAGLGGRDIRGQHRNVVDCRCAPRVIGLHAFLDGRGGECDFAADRADDRPVRGDRRGERERRHGGSTLRDDGAHDPSDRTRRERTDDERRFPIFARSTRFRRLDEPHVGGDGEGHDERLGGYGAEIAHGKREGDTIAAHRGVGRVENERARFDRTRDYCEHRRFSLS